MNSQSVSTLYALSAIVLWATLAALATLLARVPSFLLTGLALVIGSVISWPFVVRGRRAWAVPRRTLLLGVYGLFGFHFLLFMALRGAPAVEANLVNYLWPLLMVVLAPLLLRNVTLRPMHVVAALLGFSGAALAILGARHGSSTVTSYWAFAPAVGSAFVWASYSLWTQRVPPFPTAAIGLFALMSGSLALLCHFWLEPSVTLSAREWLLIALVGAGPLGAAFFFWDLALKRGDARQIGILSYITPLLSTTLLLLVTGRPLTLTIALAAGLIIFAAVIGTCTR